MCHVSDTDHHRTPAADCLHISSSCLAVAVPGSGPTGRRPAVVFEVAHESSEILNADKQPNPPLRLLSEYMCICCNMTWTHHTCSLQYRAALNLKWLNDTLSWFISNTGKKGTRWSETRGRGGLFSSLHCKQNLLIEWRSTCCLNISDTLPWCSGLVSHGLCMLQEIHAKN